MQNTRAEAAAAYPVAQAIRERRTIKKFKPDPIPGGLLTELLDVAVWAPNHKLREPWRFIAFLGEGRLQLAEAITRLPTRGGKAKMEPKAMRDYLTTIPCHLLVVLPEDPRAKEREEDYAAISALIQNLQLAAWERGIGAIWKTDDYLSSPEFRSRVGVAAGEKIVGLLHLGYPEFVPNAEPRTPAARKLTLIDNLDGFVVPESFKFKLEDNQVFFDLPAMSKEEVIQFAGEKLAALGFVGDDYVPSMLEKERMRFNSTYLGNGIAIPHGSKDAKKNVIKSGVVVLHFREAVDYGGEKVHLAVGLGATREVHLEILAELAELFESEEKVKQAVSVSSARDLIAIFNRSGAADKADKADIAAAADRAEATADRG